MQLGLLRRLHTFALSELSTASHPEPVPNDPIIRKLAIISQLAVFKDIIPGYRIRALTDQEKAEKVSQMVARTREWEQGLVVVYQTYLRLLEVELKGNVPIDCRFFFFSIDCHNFQQRANYQKSLCSVFARWLKRSHISTSESIS
jgi:nucleolar complex protein 3